MSKPIWKPSKEKVQNSNLTKFIRKIEIGLNIKFENYYEFYQWSVENIEQFWELIWKEAQIIHSENYKRILDHHKMPGARWFIGSELNFAENLLRHRDDHTAIISISENQKVRRLTYKELYAKVTKLAFSLRKMGIEKGDRIAGFVTNIPEAIIAMLATTSIGALWSSCSPDFGIKGVLDRFGQIEPKVLFAIEEYSYNGKDINCREKIDQIQSNISSIRHLVLIPKSKNGSDTNSKQISSLVDSNPLYFNELLANTSTELLFEQLPFDHPVYIMYSSGTTGVPKCIVHGAGGTLLQHFKELALHTNLKREDVITYYTTCGWMMWNWLVSSLMVGATILLYDGNPAYPDINIIWKLIDDEKISIFGTSPKYLSSCEKVGLIPKNKFRLSSLNTILSTGSPLSVENFNYVYNNVKSDLQLSSISGGTDIISCFMLGNPILPVYSGEIQCRGLGMKVEAFDENGNSIVEEKGELVCSAPFPSMPVYFWNDPKGDKYSSAYFEHFPGIWRHGDFIKITEHGGIVVYGRSDATLNPGGVRIGTAEIYRIVENIEFVLDSIVVGQQWKNDVRIILFVVVRDQEVLSKEMIDFIKNKIRENATPRHVPAIIIQVNEIPRTISGKKVELAVTNIVNDEAVKNQDALSNPESLLQFKEILPILSK